VGNHSSCYYRTGIDYLLSFGLAKKKAIQIDEQMGMAGFICHYTAFRVYPVYCPYQKHR
jgi:hypothetical protein